ncbi:hypothetical protein GCM10007382_16960 [Salinibacterium xinjiangense]|uniref:Predicted ATP-dependent endonuclease of the OLD family, contains P-loop ATPase and TOPRIM domains n=1 Tax=Salinibacterium xinjiangense TaxID=386302 RepID=A0A2C8YIM1_9MICO|nr:AAA family ATPase [Salinibacterium xinjiangense]GGK97317.1 hypothetical protein GCM10007382_16960 [Salinibacterium xinjiangense]SOE50206.1 Predicted ATP-dependent endonuclease of the OLD family, contains P-loop ATPase and TOPRIM domains [Salinibacterium xinjiangense]
MRLVKAEIQGFGRLAEGKVNLDSKVIAVVGPNEAGKTTLLRALAFVDNKATLSPSERSRGLNVPDDRTVVRVQYLLTKEEQKSLAGFDLEEQPKSLWLSRTAMDGAEPRLAVEPAPRKAVAPLARAVKELRAAAIKMAFAELDYEVPGPNDAGETPPADEIRATLRDRSETLLAKIFEEQESADLPAAMAQHADSLRQIQAELNAYALAASLSAAIGVVLAWCDREDPTEAVANALWALSPNILLFGDEDRTLGSSHALSEEFFAAPPASLRNLLGMAELDAAAFWATFVSGDEGERETLIDEANQTLATKFAAAWKQSNITAILKTEQTILSIRIKQDGKRITQFDERSAGLKMFVALVAFLAVRQETVPPILLIDEAETHLHIDAQADLVNTFMTQQQAAKIIYTTHSPACLPPDLGSNIRAVIPDPSHEYRSLLKGSFWEGSAGFSPLMLAMGAGATAFSTARYVVLAEGASEMLLLPTLIKRSIDVPDLEYQVAPGLSEVPPEMYPELDLAGARVAYLVDGDKGGLKRRVELIKGGVPEDRIITLGALTLENLLEPEAYLEVTRTLLQECNPGSAVPELPTLPSPGEEVWPPFLDKWAKANDLKMPGKRVVASRLIEEAQARPSDFGAPMLRQLHADLRGVLKRGST